MSHRTRRRLVKALARLPRCAGCSKVIRTTRNGYAHCAGCSKYDSGLRLMPQFAHEKDTKGRAVVEAMLAAGRATASGLTLDIPEPIPA